jgi:type IV secretory pathway protease TraF
MALSYRNTTWVRGYWMILNDSEYLLMSDVNPNSIDARYFGLIAGLQIQHVVEPFFTWDH